MELEKKRNEPYANQDMLAKIDKIENQMITGKSW